MKNFLLILPIIFISCNSNTEPITVNLNQEEDNFEVTDNITYYRGKRFTGTTESFYENGQLKTRGIYLRGRKEGLYQLYHENGQLKGSGTFIKGKEEGLFESYFENGKKQSSETYNNGKVLGPCIYYKSNGKIEIEGDCNDDRITYNLNTLENITYHLIESGPFQNNNNNIGEIRKISFFPDGRCKIVGVSKRTEKIEYTFYGMYKVGFSKYEDTGGDFTYIKVDWKGYTSRGPMCYSVFSNHIVQIKDFNGYLDFDQYGPIVKSWRSYGGLVDDFYVYYDSTF